METFVVLSPGFPANEEDTACLPAFQQFALSLKKQYPKVEFYFITFQYPFERKEYDWHGIKVISLGGKNKPGFARLTTWLTVIKTLIKLKNNNKPIGILSLWLTECALVGKYFCKIYGIKHFMWLIGQDAKKSNQYIKRIKPKGEEIIAMSDFLQESYFTNHAEKPFVVIENGINENVFPAFNSGERKIDVLGVGSLIELKNYNLFIDIIFELQKSIPSIHAAIAGAGEQENNLKQKVKDLNLENNISFLGLLSHSETLALMNTSKVFLHTSHYEGNSTVLTEALYSGCYTLSTQSLSNKAINNLLIYDKKDDFIKEIRNRLEQVNPKAERIIFNTMDASAKKIMDLFLN